MGGEQDHAVGGEVAAPQRRLARIRAGQQRRALRPEPVGHRLQFGRRPRQRRQRRQLPRFRVAAAEGAIGRHRRPTAARLRRQRRILESARRPHAQERLRLRRHLPFARACDREARLHGQGEAPDQPRRIASGLRHRPLRQHREGQGGEGAGRDDPQRPGLAQNRFDPRRENLPIERMRRLAIEPVGRERVPQPPDQRDHPRAVHVRPFDARLRAADRHQIDAAEGGHDGQQRLVRAQVAAQGGQVGPLGAARFDPAGKVARDARLLRRHRIGRRGAGCARVGNAAVGGKRLEQPTVRRLQCLAAILQRAHARRQRGHVDVRRHVLVGPAEEHQRRTGHASQPRREFIVGEVRREDVVQGAAARQRREASSGDGRIVRGSRHQLFATAVVDHGSSLRKERRRGVERLHVLPVRHRCLQHDAPHQASVGALFGEVLHSVLATSAVADEHNTAAASARELAQERVDLVHVFLRGCQDVVHLGLVRVSGLIWDSSERLFW